MLLNFTFIKAMIYPERISKPFSQCHVIRIATYVSLTCYSGVKSALSFSKWISRTSEMNCLILLVMNEIYPNAQIMPIAVFHSAVPPLVGTGSPSKHIQDFVDLEKQIKLFKSCKVTQSLFMAYGILRIAFTTCFGIAYFKMFYWVHVQEK